MSAPSRVPDGWQLELWWPKGKEEYPQTIVFVTFDRTEFIAELNRRLTEDPRNDYKIVAGPGGFEVYEVTREQL